MWHNEEEQLRQNFRKGKHFRQLKNNSEIIPKQSKIRPGFSVYIDNKRTTEIFVYFK